MLIRKPQRCGVYSDCTGRHRPAAGALFQGFRHPKVWLLCLKAASNHSLMKTVQSSEHGGRS